jgi:hypothetical protein
MNKNTSALVICAAAIIVGAYFLSINKQTTNEPPAEMFTQSGGENENQEVKASPSETTGSVNNEEDIRFAFEQYKTAILSRNSGLAIKYLDQNTIDYYTDMLNLVKKGTKTEIQNRRLLDQMTVLIVRHLLDKAAISRLNSGTSMLDVAIKEGLIGEQSVSGLSVHSVKISGDVAYMELNTDHGVAPQKFKFVKEGGVWKMDLTSIFPESNIILESAVKDAGFTKEEFIFQVLESQSGIKPTASIWEPLF